MGYEEIFSIKERSWIVIAIAKPKMRSFSELFFFSRFLLLLVFLLLLGHDDIINGVPAVYSLGSCAQHDQSSLLHLKQSLVFDPVVSIKLVTWNSSSSNCCVWDGVTCNADGQVIGLDLSRETISGGIEDSNSPLFDLHHLQSLDLSYNSFNGTHIPSGIGKLVNLLHLDLSLSDFAGQVPAGISSLTSLITLDLSDYHSSTDAPTLRLENPKLSTLVQNLTKLTQLKLDSVNMSAEGEGYKWCHALSSLPNLQVLSLFNCSLSGPLHVSLAKLQGLSVIDWSANNLSCAVPEFFVNFSNLTSLKLKDCSLRENFPQNIFSIMTLQTLDLTGNKLLSGMLPESVGNLKSLANLNLDGCGFTSTIDHIQWENLENLVYLDLKNNSMNGSIPVSLFSLSLLISLDLSFNQFSGQLGESLVVSSFSVLPDLSLTSNKLEGPIPTFMFNLESLASLDLSHNNFSGTIDLTYLFQNLSNLESIYLSFNSLSLIQNGGSISTIHSSFPPQLTDVFLASCGLQQFPDLLRNQSMLQYLDLSENEIHGQIPNWIWKPDLFELDLSHNALTGFQTSLPNLTSLSSVSFLNLKSNLIQGQILLPPYAYFLDYSMNNFNSVIPFDIGNQVSRIGFFSLSSNHFQGTIPPSICNISKYTNVVVDLSNNSLSGSIPPCLIAMNLGVLNLKGNNLTGNIPNAFQGNCSLQTLDLSDNQLCGTIPKSTVNCKAMEVVNLGGNELSGGFPCWLMQVSSLRVLVLRSNKFSGSIRCALSNARTNSLSKLQIIDIAANHFHGEFPHESFKTWTGMMAQTLQQKSDQLGFGSYGTLVYYQDTVTVTMKGLSMELVKILTVYNAIDFSCNHFEGSIPQSIGDLKSLFVLNLSHNHFTGHIPSSIGNLKAMESLDLANNSLSGVLPVELASLTFISYLNLSFNQLVGRIPTSTQLQSFSKWSYTGNKGLYGAPLETNCTSTCGPHESPPDPTSEESEEIDWQLIFAEMGYSVGLGAVIGSLVFWRKWRVWYFEHVDRVLFRIFPWLEQRASNHGRRRRRGREHRGTGRGRQRQ